SPQQCHGVWFGAESWCRNAHRRASPADAARRQTCVPGARRFDAPASETGILELRARRIRQPRATYHVRRKPLECGRGSGSHKGRWTTGLREEEGWQTKEAARPPVARRMSRPKAIAGGITANGAKASSLSRGTPRVTPKDAISHALGAGCAQNISPKNTGRTKPHRRTEPHPQRPHKLTWPIPCDCNSKLTPISARQSP